VLVIAARTSTIAASKVIEIVRRCWPIRILVGAGPEDADHARRALDAGASAVVARPYEIDSIFAMGLGLTPRRPPPNDLQAEEDTLIAGPITIDLRGHEARVRGREVRLTHRELELLAYLIRQRGRATNSASIQSAAR
jgi:DNA-binding response OmpR family regulator